MGLGRLLDGAHLVDLGLLVRACRYVNLGNEIYITVLILFMRHRGPIYMGHNVRVRTC